MKEIQEKHPDQKVELWCQDETRIGQKGCRTRTWAEKGTRPTAPIDTRYENTYLFGAFCPSRDTGVALVLPKANTQMMQLHLNEISGQLPAHTHAAIIVDGAKWHDTPKLILPSNITLIKLPPYSPELNPAEKVWQFLKNNFLAHQVWNTVADIVHDACAAWNALIAEKGRIATAAAFTSVILKT